MNINYRDSGNVGYATIFCIFYHRIIALIFILCVDSKTKFGYNKHKSIELN